MNSEWANLVSLDSIQHEQSYFEVGLGVRLSLDWNSENQCFTSLNTAYTYAQVFETWKTKMNSEWANLVSLDSIQHKQSYLEVGLGFQLSFDWK